MPEISFYLLTSTSESKRYQYTCKLAEKIYRNGEKVYILTDSEAMSRRFDDLLWTFRAGSFIPHQIYFGSDVDTGDQVLIGQRSAPDNWQKNIINVSTNIPAEAINSQRILEVLDASEACKQAGRIRYRLYQQQNTTITTHKIA